MNYALYRLPPKWVTIFEWLINPDVRRVNRLEAREQRALDKFDLTKDHGRRSELLRQAAAAVEPMQNLTRLGWEEDDYAAVRLEVQFLFVAADCESSLQTGQRVPFGVHLPGREHWEAITAERDPEARAVLYEKIAAATLAEETIPGYPGSHAGDVAEMLACSERNAPDTPRLRTLRRVRKAQRIVKETVKWVTFATAVAVLGWVAGWPVVPGIAVLCVADDYAGAVIERTEPIWELRRFQQFAQQIWAAPAVCYLASTIALNGRKVIATPQGVLLTLAAICLVYRAAQYVVALPRDIDQEEGT